MSASATPATRLCVKELCVTKLCVKEFCVTKLCVKELCVKESFVTKLCKSVCMTKLSVTKWWVTKLREGDVWDKVVCDSVCKVVRDKVAGERIVCWRVGGRAGGWTGVRN